MTTTHLTISIALCTFNGERFLQEQLDSYVQQTRHPDKVIICDDGSTDRTLEILEKWAGTVPFEVQIFRNKKISATRKISRKRPLSARKTSSFSLTRMTYGNQRNWKSWLECLRKIRN